MQAEVFLLVLFSAICHAGWNLAARRSAGDIVILWLALWTGAIVLFPLVLGVVVLDAVGESFSLPAIACMVATGVLHAIYFALLAQAYEHGEISLVYPIARGAGVGLTALGAPLIFGERISFGGAWGIVLVLLGILLLGIPAFRQGTRARAIGLALGVGVSTAAYSLVDKFGVSMAHPVIYLWAMFLVPVAAFWPFVVRRYSGSALTIARANLKYVLSIGLGSSLTYLMVLVAFTMGPVSYIVATRECSVAVGAFLGMAFLGERFTVAKGLAVALIVLGLVFIKLG